MATPTRSSWMSAWENDLKPSAAARRSKARCEARVQSARYYGREATARVPLSTPHHNRAQVAPALRIVTRRKPRRGAILIALVLALLLLGAGVVCPVMVSSAATGVESAVGKLEIEQRQLAATGSALSAQVSALSSPERVAEQAEKLGLEPATSVHYVDMGSGAAASEGDTTIAGR